MISLLLAQKIIELFVILAAGYVVVKSGVVKSSDAYPLSIITLYLVAPAPLLTAFEVDLTADLARSLALVFVVALASNFAAYLIGWAFARITGADVVERASVTYSNAGNLILPVVTSVLGEQYVIYCMGYMVVQTFMLWTLLQKMFAGEARITLRQIFTNINIIMMFVGFAFMLTGFRMPPVLDTAVRSLGSMLGPMSMLIVGMTLAGLDLRTLRERRRVWLVVLAKMVVSPLIIISLLKLSGVASLIPDGETIMMVPMLAAASCTATSVTQFAQLHGCDPEYASAINVLTTLACVITMPLMVQFYLW